MDLEPIMRVAVRAAARSAEVLRARWKHPISIDPKGPNDLVTDADIASEEAIIRTIQSVYPQHGIVAEESGAQPGSGEERWLVDPLDGTVNFAHQVPSFAVSIAFARGNEVLAAVGPDTAIIPGHGPVARRMAQNLNSRRNCFKGNQERMKSPISIIEFNMNNEALN